MNFSTMKSTGQRAVFLPGVRKCGTTTLFDMLSRHSEIAGPLMKEPQFFALDPATVAENIDWYCNLFPESSEKIFLDGSTLCFGSSAAPELINGYFEEPRVIFVIRDPAKRAYSAYLHMHKQVPTSERRSFQAILQGLESATTAAEVRDRENAMLEEAFAEGLADPDIYDKDFFVKRDGAPFEAEMEDRYFPYRYFHESQYRERIEMFQQVFADRQLVIFFEELIRDPTSVIQQVLDFLGLAPETGLSELSHQNKTTLPKSFTARRLMEFQETNKMGRFISKFLKAAGARGLGQKIRKKWLLTSADKLSEQDYHATRKLLAEEYTFWFSRYPQLQSLWKY